MISHLAGRARAWAMAVWGRDSPLCYSLEQFRAALRSTFEPVSTEREKARQLTSLRQGRGSVSDYAVRFRTLAVESGWCPTALYDIFLKGLSVPIQEQLVPLDLPTDLDDLITLAIRTGHRLHELQQLQEDRPARGAGLPQPSWPDRQNLLPAPGPPRTGAADHETMQLGRARL